HVGGQWAATALSPGVQCGALCARQPRWFLRSDPCRRPTLRRRGTSADRSGSAVGRRGAGVMRRALGLLVIALVLGGCERGMHDMYDQPKYKSLAPSPLFANGNSARTPPPGS